MQQDQLNALYRRSSHLIHLAWLDHCPNVVVDARAAGCRIVCSSSGGTEEVAGNNAIVVEEDEWDLSPLDLYSPPRLDFSRQRRGNFHHVNDMMDVAEKYIAELRGILR
jgi:glycosyltransferase involved in cell wall biosynthesis